MKFVLFILSSFVACSHYGSAFAPVAPRAFNHKVAGLKSTEASTCDQQDTKLDHEFEMSVNRIKSLVYRWMSIWDLNTGDANDLLDLLSPEGFEMSVTTSPEPITTIKELKEWYAIFPTRVKTDNHLVKTIDVTKLDDGAFGVEIKIHAPGITTTDEPFDLSSVHHWEVVDYGGIFPKIRKFSSNVINEGDGSAASFDQVDVKP